MLTELYVSLAKDALAEYSYPAYLAGLDFRLYKHLRGITIRIDGFSDKQTVLLEQIIDTLKNINIQPERFAQNKRDLDRDLRNALQNKPFERLATEARSWLLYPYWTEKQQIATLTDINQQDLEDFIPRFWERTNLVTLSHGNVSPEQAAAASGIIKNKLLTDTEVVSVPKSQVVDLSSAQWYRLSETEHQDTAYLYYLQGADKSYRSRAAFGLLAQIIGPAYYNAVRTEAQMGYIVFATPYSLLEVPALAFIVQSPSHSIDQIHQATQAFLQSFAAQLREMPATEFARHKEALVSRLTEPDKTLEQRSDRFWTEIDTQSNEFDTMKRIAAIAGAFSVEEISQQFEEYFLDNPQSLLLTSIPEGGDTPALSAVRTVIGERTNWRTENSLFPGNN